MSWLPWKRPTPPAVPPPIPPRVEPEEPAPVRTTLLEKFAHWRAVFALQRQLEPTLDEIEQERARQERQRQEQVEDEIARLIALRGSWLPGDGDEPRQPQVTPLEGHRDGGPFYGFVRW